MRFFKVLFSIILLVVIVAGLALVALMYAIDPNKLKPVLAEQVLKQTGYQMIVQGDLSWSILPRLGVKAQRIMLHTPNQHTAFIELQDVRIATDLWQLVQGRQRLQGDVYISEVTLTNIHAQNAQANLRFENGALNIENINAMLYDGTLKGNAHCEQFAASPQWNWDLQLLNVQLKPLLTDANGPESKLKLAGIGNINLHGTTTGKTRDDVFNHLEGSTQFAINNGVLEGINLNYYVQAAAALLMKQPVPAPANMNQTDFSSLTGSAIIKQGVFQTTDVMLTAPALIAKVQGNITLLTQAVNLQMQVKPLINTTIPLEIPVAVTGDVHNPEVKLDMGEVQKFLAKQDLDQLKSKAIETIKEKVPGQAGEFLQQLIGN